MSRRNDYDYFDLDNFDDSIDSREYRRRQQQRRPASYAARPSSQRPVRRPVKRRNKRRTHDKLTVPSVVVCPECGEYKLSHRVCKHCGTYNGQKVL